MSGPRKGDCAAEDGDEFASSHQLIRLPSSIATRPSCSSAFGTGASGRLSHKAESIQSAPQAFDQSPVTYSAWAESARKEWHADHGGEHISTVSGPRPSGVQPCAIICARAVKSGVSRCLGGPTWPYLDR